MAEQCVFELLNSVGKKGLTPQQFIECSNRLLELSVRNVRTLPRDAEIRARYQLNRFAVRRNLSAAETVFDSKELTLERVQQAIVEVLRSRKAGSIGEDDDVLAVDDSALLRLRIIHSELMFLRTMPELSGIPLHEVTFCVALFLLVFAEEPRFDAYKLLLNWRNVTEFLEATVAALRMNKVTAETRRIFRRLKQTYAMAQKLYHLSSILEDIAAITHHAVNEQINTSSLDRLLYRMEYTSGLLIIPIEIKQHFVPFFQAFKAVAVKDHLEANEKIELYQSFLHRLPIFEAAVKVLYFLHLSLVLRHFLKGATKCRSMQQLHSLFRYVQQFDTIVAHQEIARRHLVEFYTNLESKLPSQGHLKLNASEKLQFVSSLETTRLTSLNLTRIVSLSEDSFEQIKLQISLVLANSTNKSIQETVSHLWRTIEPELEASKLETKAFSCEEIINDDRNSDQQFVQIEPGTSRSEPKLVSANSVEQLQLQALLKRYNCSSIDDLTRNHSQVPHHIRMALDHLMQLQFTNTATGSDTLSLLRCGSGLVPGRQYLEYLRTNDPSYRLAMFDVTLYGLISALVLAECCVSPELDGEVDCVPEGLQDIRFEGLKWGLGQQKLLQSVLDLQVEQVRQCVASGSNLKGRFLCCLGKYDGLKYYSFESLVIFKCREQSNNWEVLSDMGIDLHLDHQSSDFRLQLALNLMQFEDALSLSQADVAKLDFRLFAWSDLIDNLIERGSNPLTWSEDTFNLVVERLVRNVNYRSLEALLEIRSICSPSEDLVLDTISTGCRNLFTALLGTRLDLGSNAIQQAIMNHLNQPVLHFLSTANETSLNRILPNVVKSNNTEIAMSMIDLYPMLSTKAIELSAHYNRYQLALLTLEKAPKTNLDTALFISAEANHWKLANFLLSYGANPHSFQKKTDSNERESLRTAFQIAVGKGNYKFVTQCPIDPGSIKDADLPILAAAAGSSRLVRYLRRIGFCAIPGSPRKIGSTAVIVRNLSLYLWGFKNTELTRWYYLLEQWKHFEYMKRLLNDDEFLRHGSLGDKRTILRKFKLYSSFDDSFHIQAITTSVDGLSNVHDIKTPANGPKFELCCAFQRKLKESCVCLAPQTCDFHFYSGENYAFVKLSLFVSQAVTLGNNTSEVSILLHDLTFDTINDEIRLFLLKNDLYPRYTLDVRMFQGDTLIRRSAQLVLETDSCLVDLTSSDTVDERYVQHWNHEMRAILDEISQESRLLLAVGSGDLESTRILLDRVDHPDHDDLWLDPELIHRVIDFEGTFARRKLTIAKLLLKAGLHKWSLNPKVIKSFIEHTFSANQPKLALVLLTKECSGLSEYGQFRKVLQYDSVEAFKMFLEMNKFSEQSVFQNICNALIEMNIKGVLIGEILHNYLLYKLSSFGVKHYCGDPETPKMQTEWLDSINVIVDLVDTITNQFDCVSFSGIDNELLFRLQMIHNQMYLIKHIGHLKEIPLRKVIFLLAVFITTFRDESFNVYRMVINKPTVIEFLQLVTSQLKSFRKRYLAKVNSVPPKPKKLLRKLNNVYYLVRQLYSLNKVVNTLENCIPHIIERQINDSLDKTKSQKTDVIAAVKRAYQIFGECIKNSDNSDNLPKKLYGLLLHSLSPLMEQNKRTRDKSCHNFPLLKKSFSVDEQFWNILSTVYYLDFVRVTIASVVHHICSQYFRHLYELLRRCESLERMQNLIRFVGDQQSTLELQQNLLESIKRFHNDHNKYLGTITKDQLPPESQMYFHQYQLKGLGRTTVILLLEAEASMFFYEYRDIQALVFAAEDIAVCRRALSVNLSQSAEYDPLEEIASSWQMIVEDVNSLSNVLTIGKSVLFLAHIQHRYELFPKSAQEYHCQGEIDQIMKHFFADNTIPCDEQVLRSELDKELDRRYFSNIFAIDAKAQAITKVFTNQNIPLCKRKLKTLREKDILELQQIFDAVRSSIRRVLTTHDCETIDKLIVNVNQLPMEAVLAIEYYLLEMCEILGTTKQFQDNFHTIKQDAQFICGRNFRNYLAHDSISYDLLTNSSRVKVVVNALVMVETDWKLFHKPEKRDLKGLFDVKTAGIGWIEVQNKLKRAILDLDAVGVTRIIEGGGLVTGTFVASLGPFTGEKTVNFSQILLNSKCEELSKLTACARSILAMVDPAIHTKKWNAEFREKIILTSMVANADFQTASQASGITSWGALLNSPTLAFNKQLCLGSLIKYLSSDADTDAIRDLLLWHGSEVFTALLCVGVKKAIDLILKEFVTDVSSFEKAHSILIQHNDVDNFPELPTLYTTTLGMNYTKLMHDRLALAAKYNNSRVFETLLQTCTFDHSNPLVKTFLACAQYGRTSMLRSLLEHEIQLFSNVDEALQRAASFARWTAVHFLLDKGANPWQRNPLEISAANYAIKFRCSTILRRFASTAAPTVRQRGEQCLSYAAENRSVPMMRALLTAGFDLWRDKFVFMAALQGQKKPNIAFVKKRMLKCHLEAGMDPGLREWFRALHECKMMRYLQNSGKVYTGNLANRLDELCEVVERLADFCKIADVGYVELVDVDGRDPIDSLDGYISMCSAVQDEIQRLRKLRAGDSVPFELLYTNGENIFYTLEGTFISYYELENPLQSNPLSEYCYYDSENLPLRQICTDILQTFETHCPSFSCNFSHNNQSYRLLKIGSNHCLMRLLQPTDPSPLKKFLNSQNSFESTLLQYLPATVSLRTFELLIVHGADLGVVNCDGKTALFQLLYPQFSWTTIKPIFDYCFRNDLRDTAGNPIFETRTRFGETLFFESIRKGRLEVTEYLLQHCSKQRILQIPSTTLNAAASHTFIRIAALLIEHNPEAVHGHCTISGQSPLEQAVLVNNSELVQLLVDAGASITEDIRTQCSAAEMAIFYGSLESLRVILRHAKRHRIDVLAARGLEFNAFETAVNNDNVELLDILAEFEVGAHVDHAISDDSLGKLRNFLLSTKYTSQKCTLYTLAIFQQKDNVAAYLHKLAKIYNQAFEECG